MKNINILVPDELHKQLKLIAAVEGKSLKQLFTEALEEGTAEGGGFT